MLAIALPGGVRKSHLETSRGHSLQLIAPDDDFYTVEDYTLRFGDLAAAKKNAGIELPA